VGPVQPQPCRGAGCRRRISERGGERRRVSPARRGKPRQAPREPQSRTSRQFGANNSNALLARQYTGGGLTAFGLVPGRPDDTLGVGLAWTWLTRGDLAGNAFFDNPNHLALPLRPSQLMIEQYYQMMVTKGLFFQTALTEIPDPGQHAGIPSAFALTLRLITLF
jgi:porin